MAGVRLNTVRLSRSNDVESRKLVTKTSDATWQCPPTRVIFVCAADGMMYQALMDKDV